MFSSNLHVHLMSNTHTIVTNWIINCLLWKKLTTQTLMIKRCHSHLFNQDININGVENSSLCPRKFTKDPFTKFIKGPLMLLLPWVRRDLSKPWYQATGVKEKKWIQLLQFGWSCCLRGSELTKQANTKDSRGLYFLYLLFFSASYRRSHLFVKIMLLGMCTENS